MKRRPLIAANWKMHLGRTEEALALIRALRPRLSSVAGVDVVICPPFPVLAPLAEVLEASPIVLGAQTMHWKEAGAYTGDVSPAMLAGLCQFVILGHSERRASAGPSETDAAINRKVHAALEHGLSPIICVGESAEQRGAGATHEAVGSQVSAALDGVRCDRISECAIAYEPLWAIGTGEAASPAGANRTIAVTVRGVIAGLCGEASAQTVRILYGGSVDPENIAAFMAMPDIDGALVGGASLGVGFAELVRRAVESRQ